MHDAAAQCADGQQLFLVCKTDSVQADSQPYHVELCFGKAFDTGRVADMADDVFAGECFQQPVAHGRIACDLSAREIVVALFIAAGQMREHRADVQGALVPQCGDHTVDVAFGETEAVHPGIEFQVDRVTGFAVPPHGLRKSFER